MQNITRDSWHRSELLNSESAACFHCQEQFAVSEIVEWGDEDADGVCQTAVCPRCHVDAVVGFTGQVDPKWLAEMHASAFY